MSLARRVGAALRSLAGATPAHPKDPALAAWFGGRASMAGPIVTEDTALSIAAAHACVNILAETMACLPLHIYRRTDDNGRELARGHPAYPLLHVAPNAWCTAYDHVEMMMRATAVRGFHVSEVVYDARMRPVGREPHKPGAGTWRRGGGGGRGGGDDGAERRVLIDRDALFTPWHLRADGTVRSPLAQHQETFGLAIAQRDHQAASAGHNATPNGVIKSPAALGEAAAKSLRDSWESRHRGPQNAGRVAILDGGLDYAPVSISNRDMQAIELMKLSVVDIARIYRVPLHKINDLERATFSNIEHQSIEFVRDTVLPWARRLEQRIGATLLSDAERAEYFVQFDLRGLLRGDAKTRAEYYRHLFYLGALTPNEIRRFEDLAPLDGPEADRPYVQGATVPLDMLGATLGEAGRDG